MRYVAGAELGSGAYLNPVPPEDAAAMHENRSDRNAALAQARFGLGDGGGEEWIGRHATIIA